MLEEVIFITAALVLFPGYIWFIKYGIDELRTKPNPNKATAIAIILNAAVYGIFMLIKLYEVVYKLITK